jgi:hypothetical protein
MTESRRDHCPLSLAALWVLQFSSRLITGFICILFFGCFQKQHFKFSTQNVSDALTHFTCFTSTQVQVLAQQGGGANARAKVFSLHALLVQKYKYLRWRRVNARAKVLRARPDPHSRNTGNTFSPEEASFPFFALSATRDSSSVVDCRSVSKVVAPL